MHNVLNCSQFTPTCPPQAGVNYLSESENWVQSNHEERKIYFPNPPVIDIAGM